MLWKIEIENFFSIREKEELNLAVARNVPDFPHRLVAPMDTKEDRASRVAVLFGANASGKSTVLRAISFIVNFVQGNLSWGTHESSPLLSFQHQDYIKKPTRIYVEFDSSIIEDEPHCMYSYELVLNPLEDGLTHEVAFEELRFSPKGKYRRIFKREGNDFLLGKSFDIRKDDMRLTFVKQTASTIATLAQFNHQPSMNVLSILQSVQSNVGIISHSLTSYENATEYYHKNEDVFNNLKNSIKMMDLGIENVELTQTSRGIEAQFKHSGHDAPLPYIVESDGTKNFYCLFPSISFALEYGGLAVMDEMDRDIHPLLLPEVVSWFHNPSTNPHNAQLIMSCHNATLLEYLIKEEVFFTEKTSDGHTQLYGLKDVEGVRRDANLYSKYLGGYFGAVPKIG